MLLKTICVSFMSATLVKKLLFDILYSSNKSFLILTSYILLHKFKIYFCSDKNINSSFLQQKGIQLLLLWWYEDKHLTNDYADLAYFIITWFVPNLPVSWHNMSQI